jgi:heat shock protein HspQ
LIERIENIPNLKFYAEGSAAKNPEDEPGMVSFMKDSFPNYRLEKRSWDELTEEKNHGSANPLYNVVFTFLQHRYNKTIDLYTEDKGTMLEAMAKPNKRFPKNSPLAFKERLKWLTYHMKKAGFYDSLNQPYNKNKMLKIFDEMEETIYPGKQQYPNTRSYFGKLAFKTEMQRNQMIYNLMQKGGCCFAGAGHLIELKQQFPNLELIGRKNIS